MDSTRLKQLKESVYIPPAKTISNEGIPPYHPCLIVQDKQSETKLKACGCADVYCVKDAPKWI